MSETYLVITPCIQEYTGLSLRWERIVRKLK